MSPANVCEEPSEALLRGVKRLRQRDIAISAIAVVVASALTIKGPYCLLHAYAMTGLA
jgi:hypothetical protein